MIAFDKAKGKLTVQPPTTYFEGVITNLPAFVNLILDRRIWKKAPLRVQEILYESLAKLVTTHELAAFNVFRFRSANVSDKLLMMFQGEDSLPLSLAPSFITIIRSTMTDPSVDDLGVSSCIDCFGKSHLY